jgi:hypothetical protein
MSDSVRTLVVDACGASPAGLVRVSAPFDIAKPTHICTFDYSTNKFVFRDERGVAALASNPRTVFGLSCTLKQRLFIKCRFLNDPSGREHEYLLRNTSSCSPWKYEAVS